MVYIVPIPPAIETAHSHLARSGICELDGGIEAEPRGVFSFRCRLAVPMPNVAGLPCRVTLRVALTEAFPFGDIQFFPVEDVEGVRGFPHQDAETGKLCLPAEHDGTWDEHRLTKHVRWAADWLSDAANGTLLKPGDPYELPDFSRKHITDRFPTDLPLFVDESADTYSCWHGRERQSGIVELRRAEQPHGFFAQRFLTSTGTVIRSSSFSLSPANRISLFRGQWLLLPKVTVERHRPAQTYGQLLQLCGELSVGLWEVLKTAWVNGSNAEPFGILLIGFPIPREVDGPPCEIHWQPLLFPNEFTTKRVAELPKGKRNRGQLWHFARTRGCFAKHRDLLWGNVDNLSRGRQYARGAQPASVRTTPIVLLGCGALGAPIAEALARGGVQDIALFDGQKVEFGNLCRHTLDGRDAGRGKAAALAHRLRCSNPKSSITDHAVRVPWHGHEPWAQAAQQAFDRATTFIDCTTDHGAFLWLSHYARNAQKRLTSVFINPHAEFCTVVLSGKQTSAAKVYRKLMQAIGSGETSVAPDAYFAELSDGNAVLPGAGCWHATFPALNSHIWLLAYSALEHMVAWLERPLSCDGYGIILRRNPGNLDGPIVETIWRQPYR